MPNPEHKKMTAMHFYGWEKGLKTGQYYLRSRPAADAIKFTVNMEELLAAAESKDKDALVNALEKVKEVKSVNLGKKTVMPQGGLSDVKQGSANKA
jgi:ribonucleoside-diphosphate reductase subunit M1